MSEPIEDRYLLSTAILSREQLASIGCVAVESTYCENLIESLIWQLCNLDESQGKFFTDQTRIDKRLDLLSDLAKPKIHEPYRLTEFINLISDLKEINKKRNTIIHGNWNSPYGLTIRQWFDGPKPDNPAIAIKRRLRSDPIEFSATEIEEVALSIANLTQKLYVFSLETWQELP